MKAIEVAETGGPEVLTYVDKEQPSPDPGEVLIKAEAIGVNFIDTYFRSGQYPREVPFVVGTEVCGTVEAIGVTPAERPQEQVQQAPLDSAAARGLIWLNAVNRQQFQPDLWTIYQPWVDPRGVQDAAAKVDALQKQVEQLLKEVTALREAVQKQPDAGTPKK